MITINYTLDSTRTFGVLLNNILSNIKMMHWYTTNYNLHLIFGELYNTLSDLFDKLQEEIIGTAKTSEVVFPDFQQISSVSQFELDRYVSDENILESYDISKGMLRRILSSIEFKEYVENIDSGINNTAEEIITALNKANYLISMIKI